MKIVPVDPGNKPEENEANVKWMKNRNTRKTIKMYKKTMKNM